MAGIGLRGILAAVCAFGVTAMTPAPVSADLAGYYSGIQRNLQSKGYLRRDVVARDAPFDARTLARDFASIALRQEYRGGLSGSGKSKPLLRWEEPVRMAVNFGPSISQRQRQDDLAMIGHFSRRLSNITGHPVQMTRGRANFHVLVVTDAERRGLGPYLKANVAGLSDRSIRAVLNMRPNHLCMVVAVPHADKSRGYRSAVAIVRAEHSGMMRRSCIEEELAQGMGLPNDCKDARPSIFNDDGEFAVLTRHDEMLLRILYNRSLRSGMTAAQAMPVVEGLSRRMLGG